MARKPKSTTRKAAGATTEAAAAKPNAIPALSFKLGERVRRIRTEKDLTLGEAAERAGLARSTLSKIENEQTSPTFEVLLKLAAGLAVAMDELLALPRAAPPSGRRSITRANQGRRHDMGVYTHEFLCPDLTHKTIVPSKARINARSVSEFADWVRHEGEDFLLVLEGAVELHTEFYEPVKLQTGDCAYYDARMGHFCISISDQDALVLWVPTHGGAAAASLRTSGPEPSRR